MTLSVTPKRIMGRRLGRVMRQNLAQGPAPSSVAASYRSRWDGLQRGQVQHQVEAHIAPEHHDGHGHLELVGLGQPGCGLHAEDAAEHRVHEAVVGREQRGEHHGDGHRGCDVGQEVGAGHTVAQALETAVMKTASGSAIRCCGRPEARASHMVLRSDFQNQASCSAKLKFSRPTNCMLPRPLVGSQPGRPSRPRTAAGRGRTRRTGSGRADQQIGGPADGDPGRRFMGVTSGAQGQHAFGVSESGAHVPP